MRRITKWHQPPKKLDFSSMVMGDGLVLPGVALRPAHGVARVLHSVGDKEKGLEFRHSDRVLPVSKPQAEGARPQAEQQDSLCAYIFTHISYVLWVSSWLRKEIYNAEQF